MNRSIIRDIWPVVGFVVYLICFGLVVAARADGPPRQWMVYLLPHSHVDIGYTHLQPEVELQQTRNIKQALELCRKTADYPEGARFKWNVEALWAVENFMKHSPPEKQQEFIEAVRKGWIGLDALYGNILTGLCRPEELMRAVDYAHKLSQRCGVEIDSAMISDVPGYTWGIVPVLAGAGVKYFSIGPNVGARIGRTLQEWEDKPFYWVGPDGKSKLLCWVPWKGYALGMLNPNLVEQLPGHIAQLEEKNYPYDMVHLHWAIGSDNGPPDETLPEVVKNWNAAHESPKLVIATTGELFREFEQRYGDKLPVFSGDWTPFWEDGAGSSARETGINRASAERLVQAETLFAMLDPTRYPTERFSDAWRNVLLYSEHTWGAHNSITEPDAPFVAEQWAIKQAFALDADKQSRNLLADALNARGNPVASAVDVFNTATWPRTDLVTLSPELSAAGDMVVDSAGRPMPSQRLSTGELVFLAKDVPALAGRRYTVTSGAAHASGNARAEDTTLSNGFLTVSINPQTGAIESLKAGDHELVDLKSGAGLNEYLYLLGSNPADAQPNGPAQVRVVESGPLAASLEINSDAPGCNRLVRQVRLISGLDRVELVNIVDKKAVREKEGVHFRFGFNVPDGVLRMDIPWAVVRPEIDQLPAACKSWFTIQRFVDISNDRSGMTWSTIDAPLMEIGSLTANIAGFGTSNSWMTNPADFVDHLEPSQIIYSWVMNNHWFTNYRAEQAGPTTFRYAIRPHGGYDPVAAQRFGIEQSQPLIVTAARGPAPSEKPLLEIEPAGVLVSSIRPVGDILRVRLFNATGKQTRTVVRCGSESKIVELAPWQVESIEIIGIR